MLSLTRLSKKYFLKITVGIVKKKKKVDKNICSHKIYIIAGRQTINKVNNISSISSK